MKYGYMWQKVHEAVDALMWTDDPERAKFAFHALAQLEPSQCLLDDAEAAHAWETVDEFSKRAGTGLDKAARMSSEEKREFCEALLKVYGYLWRDQHR